MVRVVATAREESRCVFIGNSEGIGKRPELRAAKAPLRAPLNWPVRAHVRANLLGLLGLLFVHRLALVRLVRLFVCSSIGPGQRRNGLHDIRCDIRWALPKS